MKYTIVKVKTICTLKMNGEFEYRDNRYKAKKPIKKIIKYCLKNGFSFRVGFHNSSVIPNKKYIEIIDEWFIHLDPNERDYWFRKGIALIEWL